MTAKSFLPTALCAFVIAFQQIQYCASADNHFNEGINESNIIEIDGENFQEAVNSTKYALVQFYAPWCPYSKEFRPVFAEASLQLKEWKTPILVAKIDGDSHKELTQKFQISTFPTTLWFENGQVQAEYPNGDPTAPGIITWVERVLNGSSVELTSVDQLSELERELQAAAVVAYFKNNKNGEEYTAFRKLALAEATTAFYRTSSIDVAKELEIGIDNKFDMAVLRRYPGHPPAVALFSSQERLSEIDENNDGALLDKLESFFEAQKLPDYINYEDAREDSGRLLLSVPIPYHMYVLGPGSTLNDDATTAALRGAAAELRGNIGLLISNIADKDENGENKVADLFEIGQDSAELFAGVVGIANNNKYICGLQPGVKLTSTALVACGHAVLSGNATRLYTSAPVPEDPKDGNVTVVVGTTVDTIAKDPTKDVILEVYAPWCSACQAFAKTYNKLAAAMASSVPSVVVAKVDRTKNEHVDLDVEDLVAAIQAKAKVPFEIPNLEVFENTDFENTFEEEDDEYLDPEMDEGASATAAAAAGEKNVQPHADAAINAALHEEL